MFLNAGFDFSQLSPGYASKAGIYDPDRAAERATQVRHWLRQRPEREIVCEYSVSRAMVMALGLSSAPPLTPSGRSW